MVESIAACLEQPNWSTWAPTGSKRRWRVPELQRVNCKSASTASHTIPTNSTHCLLLIRTRQQSFLTAFERLTFKSSLWNSLPLIDVTRFSYSLIYYSFFIWIWEKYILLILYYNLVNIVNITIMSWIFFSPNTTQWPFKLRYKGEPRETFLFQQINVENSLPESNCTHTIMHSEGQTFNLQQAKQSFLTFDFCSIDFLSLSWT